MNHQLVAEVAKVTVASAILLASSPSRLTGLSAEDDGRGAVTVRWDPALESDVTHYLVTFGPAGDAEAVTLEVTETEVTLEDVGPGSRIAVKAVNRSGLEGWDRARVEVGG